MNIFLTMGHGTDDITVSFEERKTLKKGFKLVTLAECGVIANKTNVVPYMNAFTDESNYELLLHAEKYREELSRLGNSEIHVYQEGDKYPDLTLQFFIDWESDTKNKVDVTKSGMYKFPIKQSDLVITDAAAGNDKYFGEITTKGYGFTSAGLQIENIDEVKKMFQGSLLPTEDFVESTLTKNKSLNRLKESTIFSLDRVFDILREGVYYFVVCRSAKNIHIKGYVNNYFLPEEKPEGFENSANRIKFIPAVLPKMEQLKLEEQARLKAEGKKKWNTNTVLEAPNQFRSVYNKVMATRIKSKEKQHGSSRRNKTKRKNRSQTWKACR